MILFCSDYLYFFAIVLRLAQAQYTIVPRNTAALGGGTPTLNCSKNTSVLDGMAWREYISDSRGSVVSVGKKIFDEYKEKYSITESADGTYNLQLLNLTEKEAGLHSCAIGVADQRFAAVIHLTQTSCLVSTPVIEGNNVTLSCETKVSGKVVWTPHMNLTFNGSDLAFTNHSSGPFVKYTASIPITEDMKGGVFSCYTYFAEPPDGILPPDTSTGKYDRRNPTFTDVCHTNPLEVLKATSHSMTTLGMERTGNPSSEGQGTTLHSGLTGRMENSASPSADILGTILQSMTTRGMENNASTSSYLPGTILQSMTTRGMENNASTSSELPGTILQSMTTRGLENNSNTSTDLPGTILQSMTTRGMETIANTSSDFPLNTSESMATRDIETTANPSTSSPGSAEVHYITVPRNTAALDGESVTLNCSKNTSIPHNMAWREYISDPTGSLVSNERNISIRYEGRYEIHTSAAGTYNLHILNLTANEAGPHNCVFGVADERFAAVIHLTEPYCSESGPVAEGDNVTLLCETTVTGKVAWAPIMNWTMNDRDIPVTNESSGQLVKYTASITATADMHGGVFSCYTYFTEPPDGLMRPDSETTKYDRHAPVFTHVCHTSALEVLLTTSDVTIIEMNSTASTSSGILEATSQSTPTGETESTAFSSSDIQVTSSQVMASPSGVMENTVSPFPTVAGSAEGPYAAFPQNTAEVGGQLLSLNCSKKTSVPYGVAWREYASNVMGSLVSVGSTLYPGYEDKYSIQASAAGTFNLLILNLTENEAGLHNCAIGAADERLATVIHLTAPNCSGSGPVAEGDNVTLSCETTVTGKVTWAPLMNWTINGRDIPVTNESSGQVVKYTANVTVIASMHGGVFSCYTYFAEPPAGILPTDTATRKYDRRAPVFTDVCRTNALEVLTTSTIPVQTTEVEITSTVSSSVGRSAQAQYTSVPQNTAGLDGSSVKLSCSRNTSVPGQVAWREYISNPAGSVISVETTIHTGYEGRYRIQPTGTAAGIYNLQLLNLTEYEAGFHMCAIGVADERFATVIHLTKPNCSVSSPVMEGENVTLSCETTVTGKAAWHPLMNWTINGMDIPVTNETKGSLVKYTAIITATAGMNGQILSCFTYFNDPPNGMFQSDTASKKYDRQAPIFTDVCNTTALVVRLTTTQPTTTQRKKGSACRSANLSGLITTAMVGAAIMYTAF